MKGRGSKTRLPGGGGHKPGMAEKEGLREGVGTGLARTLPVS